MHGSTDETLNNGEEQNSSPSSNRELIFGTILLICAQLFCASTATCIHALPIETPSLLRGLWRQTLTFLLFTPFALGVYIRSKLKEDGHSESSSCTNGETNEETPLLEEGTSSLLNQDEDTNDTEDAKQSTAAAAEQVVYVIAAMAGAAVLNDTLVIALKYASSAAVMCLINITPIWLIIYSIVRCDPPGPVTLVGAALSVVGSIVCATGGTETDDNAISGSSKNEELGSIIAICGALGSAVYMTSCRKLSPLGIHPVTLIWLVNLGQAIVSLLLCYATLDDGVWLFSTDISRGFFGFLNPLANPAALCQSVFPDCFGSFGIMLSLSFFEPLIVSMVMLTEPLNASLISMAVVHEAPPSHKTVLGVSIVLVGCAIVLYQSARDTKQACALETKLSRDMDPGDEVMQKRVSMVQQQRRRSQVVLLSPIGVFSPDVTAKAAFTDYSCESTAATKRNFSLTPHAYREMGMSQREALESSISPGDAEIKGSTRRSSMQMLTSMTSSLMDRVRRSSWFQNYGSFEADNGTETNTTAS